MYRSSLHQLYIFSKVWENAIFEHGRERVKRDLCNRPKKFVAWTKTFFLNYLVILEAMRCSLRGLSSEKGRRAEGNRRTARESADLGTVMAFSSLRDGYHLISQVILAQFKCVGTLPITKNDGVIPHCYWVGWWMNKFRGSKLCVYFSKIGDKPLQNNVRPASLKCHDR